jgi:hypothetical protein
MRGETNKYMVAVFYISWIFIGNFILLNLFLAILLDSFLEEDEEEVDQEKFTQLRRQKRQRALEKKRRKDVNKVFMSKEIMGDSEKELSKFYFGEEKGEEEEDLEDLEDLDEDQIVMIFKQQGII